MHILSDKIRDTKNDFVTESLQPLTVAGGHKISAKIVSVNTISVTFTDEIDALTNTDECCKNHGDRTTVIDLLNMCGSSQYSNVENKEYKAEKETSIPECKTTIANGRKPQKVVKNQSLASNGIMDHCEICMIHNSEHSVYTDKHYVCNNAISTSVPCQLTPNDVTYSPASLVERDITSLTLNHNYKDDGDSGIELNVYRYQDWKNSQDSNKITVTKSTLV